MLTIMLTAGSDTNNLASYIEQQQAIEVSRKFDSLTQSNEIIKQDMIDVDKLVYVLKEGMQYRTDMGFLKRNLLENDFFSVKEILFICSEQYDNEDALKFFNEVMRVTGFEKFKIIEVKDLSFAEIYSSIIGIKDANTFIANKKKNIYRKERNNISEHAYVEDDEVLNADEMFSLMEPQSIEEITRNLSLKGIIKQGDNGALIEDNHEEAPLQMDNVYLPRIGIVPDRDRDIVVITGERKSGVSILSHLLINSGLDGEILSVLLDATGTKDSAYIANTSYDYVNNIEFKDVMTQSTVNLIMGCNIINLTGATRISIFDRLRFILNNSHKLIAKVLFVECRLEDLPEIATIIGDRLHSILYCTNTDIRDLTHLADNIVTLPNVNNIVMLANNIIKTIDTATNKSQLLFENSVIPGTTIKEIFNRKKIACKIIRLPRVNTIINNYDFYQAVLNIRR